MPRVAFLMDQVAGHVTNYRNIRRVTETASDIDPLWLEVPYFLEDGAIERWHRRMSFVPTYFTGIARGAVEARRGLDGADYDAIFTNASVGVFFSGRFKRTPTIIDFDSTPKQIDRMPTYTPRPDPKPIAELKFRAFRRMLHSATLLHAWSHWAARSAVEEYGVDPAKVVVNPPGVDLDRWSSSGDPKPSESDGVVRVLFVGADFSRKGGYDLLGWRAATTSRVQLDIVTKEDVAPAPGVNVHRDLQPNSAELQALYRAADLFVLPSRGECFGIATIEAMASGLPVIASDVGGTADIVDDGRNGYIVPAGDELALGAAIDSIVDDADRRVTMGKMSRVIAEERFDVVDNVHRTLDLLRGIATSSEPALPRYGRA